MFTDELETVRNRKLSLQALCECYMRYVNTKELQINESQNERKISVVNKKKT